jgi:hypothetical protein
MPVFSWMFLEVATDTAGESRFETINAFWDGRGGQLWGGAPR